MQLHWNVVGVKEILPGRTEESPNANAGVCVTQGEPFRRPCAGRGLCDALAPDSHGDPCLRRGDDSISMKPSLALDHFLPYRLSVASNAVSKRISQSYRKRFGLKIPEWRLIAILAERESMTPVEIGQAGELDKITVSRAAAALIERGLVRQRRNPGDGRSHFLSLTGDGRALYSEIAPAALAMEAELLAGFSADERDALETLLRRIEAVAQE